MGMEFSDHIADRAGGLFVLRGRRQAQFAHGIGDAPLYRLEAVTERWQRPIEDDVHRIVEIGLLGEDSQRALFHAFEIQLLVGHQPTTSARLPLRSSHSRRSPARFLASSISMSVSV